MTNYAAWDSFDVDHALNEVDQLQAVQEYAWKADDIFRRRERESLELVVITTRKAADALRSKAAVAALKDKRSHGGRSQRSMESSNVLHDLPTLRDVPDTAVTLALELSIAMDSINRELKSMLEKVDSLKSSIKHSINQRYVPSNLRDGLIFLTEVQKFSEVRNLMSCVIKRIDHFNSRVSTISNSDFANDVRHSEKSSTDSCTLKGELIQTSSTMAILIVVDDSVRNMLLFASRYASTVAIPLGEFSVGCDIARFYLKLVEESTKKVENDLAGRTESASNDSMMWVLRALSFAGLGSAYLANIHLRRVKQLQPDYPHIEPLLNYLDYCEMQRAAKLSFETFQVSVVSELTSLRRRCIAMSHQDENMFSINVNSGVSILLINRLLGEGDDADGLVPSAPSTLSQWGLGFDLHMEVEEGNIGNTNSDSKLKSTVPSGLSRDVPICGVCNTEESGQPSDRQSVDFIISGILNLQISESVNVIRNPMEAMLHENVLLKLGRRMFYEGQILFLERLQYSAEIKYVAAYLLCTAALREQAKVPVSVSRAVQGGGDVSANAGEGVGERNGVGVVERDTKEVFCTGVDSGQSAFVTYASSVQSACLVNAALCRSHRSIRKCEDPLQNPNRPAMVNEAPLPSVSTAHHPQSTPPSDHVNEGRTVLDATASLEDLNHSISCMRILDLLHSSASASTAVRPMSVVLQSRRIAILEKIKRYSDALRELEQLEKSILEVQDGLSLSSSESSSATSHSTEEIISNICGNFEFLGLKVPEFSQQNLFCEIVLPQSYCNSAVYPRREDSDRIDGKNKECFLGSVLQQIKNKKNRLIYLQKRFQ